MPKLKIVLLHVLLLPVISLTAQAATYDYTVFAAGGATVQQGKSIVQFFHTDLVDGAVANNADAANLTVSGLPPGSDIHFLYPPGGVINSQTVTPYLENSIGFSSAQSFFAFETTPATPPGDYPITFTVTGSVSGITHTLQKTYHVLSASSFNLAAKQPFPPAVAIPQFPLWEQNMTNWGSVYCGNPSQYIFYYDQSLWFYDGERVAYQIADYTHNPPPWNACAQAVQAVYQPLVIQTNGATGRFANIGIFTKGLLMNYERTGDPNSKLAVEILGTYGGGGWGAVVTSAGDTTDPQNLRETSYALEALLDKETIDKTSLAGTTPLMEEVLGQVDAALVAKNYTWWQPFMIGLGLEALIQYYNEKNPDPRIPYIIKQALDNLWTQAWDPVDHQFFYRCYTDACYTPDDGSIYPPTGTRGQPTGLSDLNFLIAPAYAWMFLQTGDPLYRERGDLAFGDGVKYNGLWAGVGSSKAFTQSYRWSFDFVKYRQQANLLASSGGTDTQSPTVSIISPALNATVAGAFQVIAEAFDNVHVTAVQFKIDGINAGSPVLAIPFETTIGTYLYSNGPHTITAVAFDAAGNSSESAPVSFTINNAANPAYTACPQTAIPTDSFQGCYYQHGLANYTEMYTDANGAGGVPPPANLGTLTVVRNDPAIHFDWANTSPAPGVDNSFFAVIWQGKFNFVPGAYTFTVTKDLNTGIRIYVDGQLGYEGWSTNNPPASPSFTLPFPYAGTHLVRVEFWRSYTNTGDSIFHPFDVSWTRGDLPVVVPMPDPVLHLPATLPLNSNIRLDNAASYTNATFIWTFTPQSSAASVSHSAMSSATAGTPSQVSQVPQFSLASLNLSPGPYVITVQAKDGFGFVSNSVSAAVTLVSADVNAVTVFPNPWRSDKHAGKLITFSNMAAGSTIKIFTVSGHEVKELTSSGAPTTWDLTNDDGNKVASGIYVYLVKDAQGNKVKGKLAVVK